jgi:DegV family protein with EDD domain
MAKVGIVTDTSSSLPRDLVKEYGIYTIPVGFIVGKKLYRDYMDITPEEFWKMFPILKETPTTSAVSLGDFREAFLDLAKTTRDIVCITLSKELSATHNAAQQAAEMVMNEIPGLNVKVIDSRTSAGGLSLIVIEAARAAKAGKSLTEVLQTVQNMIPKVKYYIMLESIKYIARIGRAPDAKTPPSAPQPPVQISPILGIVKPDTGLLQNLNRGVNLDDAIAKGIGMVKDYIDVSRPVHFLLQYPDNLAKCEQIKKDLCEKYHCAEVHIGQFSPTSITATGPMYGIAFWTD